MGNCLCKADVQDSGNKKRELLPASKCVFDKHSLHLAGDSVAAGASSAHFAASPAQNTYSTIYKCSQDTILIGLVEGVESLEASSALTAAFISNNLLQTFQETCQRYGGLDQHNQENILRTTLQSVHRKCLASPKLPRDKNSPAGAASTTVALVNLATQTCSVANVGHSRCLLAGVSGSFNSKRPHCTWASALHTTENQKERIHIERRKGTTNLIPLAARKDSASQQTVHLTRAIGISSDSDSNTDQVRDSKRSFTSAFFKGKFDVEVDINTFHLTPTEGHLIVGSSGFWEKVSAPAVALRAHLFTKFQEDQKNVVETALKDGVAFPSPAERSTFLAEHLVNFALATSADRLAAMSPQDFSQGAASNAEDLKMLPFELDPASDIIPVHNDDMSAMVGTTNASTNTGGDTGSDASKNLGEIKVRRDVFGDLACIAISLQWPTQGHQAMFQPAPSRLFHPSISTNLAQRGGEMAPRYQSNHFSDDLAPLARFRWLQLRMLVDYQRLHRREMLQRWQETVDGILKKARQRAKAVAHQVENEYSIAVNVSPLMKLSAKDGESLPARAFNVRASINF